MPASSPKATSFDQPGGYISDVYDCLPEKYTKDSSRDSYSNYDNIKLPCPTRIAIIGASGAKKTVSMVNIWANMNAWSRIYLFCKVIDEPIYKWLADEMKDVSKKVKREVFTVSSSLDTMPNPDEFDPREKTLCIFDDLAAEKSKKLEPIEHLYSWCRKYGMHGISCIWIGQSFFRLPKFIRDNTDIIVMKRINQNKDLSLILSQYTLDATKEELKAMYKLALSGNDKNFFLIDLTKPSGSPLTFRKNFLPISQCNQAQSL
jgi:hypothetical protein